MKKSYRLESESEEEYFSLDTSYLTEQFTERLQKYVQKNKKRQFRDEMARAFKQFDEFFEDHCGVAPSDNLKRLNLDPKTLLTTKKRLTKLRSSMKDDEPTVAKIANAQVSDEKKKEALALFDILQNVEPYTQEWLGIKKEISTLLKPNAPNGALEALYTQNTTKDIIRQTPSKKQDWYLNLPYEKIIRIIPEDMTIKMFLNEVRAKLDQDIYGLERVKDELMMLLHNRLRNDRTKSSFGLCGPPGVGKTSIAASFAHAVGLPFERISLGGSIDPSVFKGSDDVWIGAHPSVFLSFLRRADCANGVMLFDELDKIGSSEKGLEVQSALLEVTDPVQNGTFKDAYLHDITHDLSMLWFMFSMNSTATVNKVLLDRIKIINIPPYTTQELFTITKNYVFPRIIKDLKAEDLSLSDEACSLIVSRAGDKGLRRIEDLVYQVLSMFILKKEMEGKYENEVIITPLHIAELSTPIKPNEVHHSMYL